MDWFRFDPANYDVGSDLWLSQPEGWNSRRADLFTVTKKTPTGRMTIQQVGSDYTLQITPRGRVVGGGDWDRRCVCSAEEAAECNAERAADARRRKLAATADELAKAIRKEDGAEVARLFAELAQGMSAGTAKTRDAVEGEARQPGPKDAPKHSPANTKGRA
jgi:hypothetical protein